MILVIVIMIAAVLELEGLRVLLGDTSEDRCSKLLICQW